MLETETAMTPSKTLVFALEKCIRAATGLNLKLFERNRPVGDGTTEEWQAKKMQKDLMDKIAVVKSECIDFKKPIQHFIAENMFTSTKDPIQHYLFYDRSTCGRLFGIAHDLDATDHDGNTLLLFIAKFMASPNFPRSLCENEVDILNHYIDRGAYIYARNREGKTLIDYLEVFMSRNKGRDRAQRILDTLKSEVPSLQSLAAVRAKDLNSASDIPGRMKSFLDMH